MTLHTVVSQTLLAGANASLAADTRAGNGEHSFLHGLVSQRLISCTFCGPLPLIIRRYVWKSLPTRLALLCAYAGVLKTHL